MSELVPDLPEEISLECLTRLHYSAHSAAGKVCRRWRNLIQSKDFYNHRKETNKTHKAICLIQSLPTQEPSKPTGPPRYGVTIFDPVSRTWDRVDSIPEYPDGIPLFSQLTSSDGKLVLMGGWDPTNYEPLSHVFVYEFTTRKWRKCNDMPERRSFFAAGELDGKIIVAGGHDNNKNALKTAWAYDVTRDEWSQLGSLSQGRDECESIVIGSELWVVSGYRTETQGEFERSAEVIGAGESEWRQVSEAWRTSQSPRSCVGVSKEGKLLSWAESESEVKVGTCGVQSSDCTFVCGSAYQGGPQAFFIVDEQTRKWEKLSVPFEFSGFVQSGCCVEI